ncbi:allantoinase AllB [Erwinia sp. J316]|uniref:Allantoinase n=1 Tax=Erwinia sorbitola TaxID=2681984 RepID=A0ABW9RDG0_9GAMM|nr:allantoinase AllB [Erwinia sorbitola]
MEKAPGKYQSKTATTDSPQKKKSGPTTKNAAGKTSSITGQKSPDSFTEKSKIQDSLPEKKPAKNGDYDLIISNGLVILDSGEVHTDIAVKNGKIAAIGVALQGAKQVIDAKGLIVSPGMIDAHVHFNEPGGGIRDDWEGYVTGTRACARGGVTTIIEMPLNQLPATVDKKTLDIKYAAGKNKLAIDVASHGGLVPTNLQHDEIKQLSDGGVVGYKCFMATVGDRSIKGDFQNVDDYSLYEGMKQIAKTGKILMIHAENAAITDELGKIAQASGEKTLKAYVATRPVFTEVEAVRRAILFASITGCPINICHMSSPEGVDEVVKARAKGINVTCETCNQYLVMVTDELDEIGATAKCSPPIRDKAAQDGLWKHVLAGNIHFITSDHSPCPALLKDKDNAFEAWGGIAGVQNDIDIFFDESVQKRGMSLKQFAHLTAANPADRFALHSKGRIAVGKDADFAFIKPHCSYVLTAEDLEYRNKISAYVGRKIGARVVRTILRGTTVYSQESGVNQDFTGQYIKVANRLNQTPGEACLAPTSSTAQTSQGSGIPGEACLAPTSSTAQTSQGSGMPDPRHTGRGVPRPYKQHCADFAGIRHA